MSNEHNALARFLETLDLPANTKKALANFQSLHLLRQAVQDGNITTFEGIGPKTEEALVEAFLQWFPPKDKAVTATGNGQRVNGGINFQVLSDFFEAKDITWKVQVVDKKSHRGLVVAYLTNRAIMDRLDRVCGPGRWANNYQAGPDGGVMCGIGIEVTPGNWVWKYDGAENTKVEPVKGGFSTSMKRTAVQWGIGRYLYNLPGIWVPLNQYNKPKELPRIPAEFLPAKHPDEYRYAPDEEYPDFVQEAESETNGQASKQPARRQPARRQPQQKAQPPRKPQAQQAQDKSKVAPLGEIMDGIIAKYGETNHWGGFIPKEEKRKGIAKVNKRDYARLKKHREDYGWTTSAFNILLREVFGVQRVSQMNIEQYYCVWRLITKEAVWREFEDMALAYEAERQDARTEPAQTAEDDEPF